MSMNQMQSQSASRDIPVEIDRWNWGAFLLTWIWGLGNNTFIALLMFVPFVNVVMWFLLGAKGSVWAWRNGRWDDVAHFKRVQRKWALWGFGIWGAGVLVIVDSVTELLATPEELEPMLHGHSWVVISRRFYVVGNCS